MYKIFIKKNAMYVGMLELTTFANDKTDLPHFMANEDILGTIY